MKQFLKNARYTFILAFPVIIGQLGIMMMGVADSIMVGKIGAEPLAAASVANSIFILIFIIGIGISSAISPLTAISVGAMKYEDSGNIFKQAIIVNIITSVILLFLVILSAEMIKYLNQPPEIVKMAESYTRILGLSIIPSMIFLTFKNFIEGLSVMRPAMIVTLLANLINIFVNWLLIYGNWGFPRMGLDGAGIATASSRIFMMILLAIYVMKSEHFKRYNISLKKLRSNAVLIRKILNLGLPSGIQYFFEVGAFSFAAIMVGWLGTAQLAAHQIVLNLASISFMTALGISSAGSIIVGNAVGRKSIRETRDAGFTAIIMGGTLMGCFGILFIVLNRLLPSFYISDENVINYASSLMIIAAMFQISDGVQAVGIGVLRGLTEVKGPTVITFIAYWILGLPIGYTLAFTADMQVYGVWIGFLIGLSTSAILLTLRFHVKSKKEIEI